MNPKIFISYSTDDKELAGFIKEGLEIYGYTSFLAHEDIAPGEHWREEIIECLKKCNVFIPILTEAAKNSVWVHQESGMASVRDMVIIPLKDSYDPMGCIGKYQALRVRFMEITKHDVFGKCRDIAVFIARQTKTEKTLQSHAITLLSKVKSWAAAASYAELIVSLGKVSPQNALRIAEAAVSNDQIYSSWDAKPIIEKMLLKHSRKFDAALLGKLKKREFELREG